jgi:hypothetical protein
VTWFSAAWMDMALHRSNSRACGVPVRPPVAATARSAEGAARVGRLL